MELNSAIHVDMDTNTGTIGHSGPTPPFMQQGRKLPTSTANGTDIEGSASSSKSLRFSHKAFDHTIKRLRSHLTSASIAPCRDMCHNCNTGP